MIAYFLSADGRLDRRTYVVSVFAFYGLAVFSALATGSRLSSWSAVGVVLDKPWGMIGRAMDASLFSALPFVVAVPLGFAVLALGLWACFAVTIKRLHDFDHSGWWSAFLLFPGTALILMLFCAFTPGRRLAA